MLALNITDVKDFMNKLLIGSVFDHFWLNEATITTFNTFTVDGQLQKDFFDSDAREALERSARTCSLWMEVKPFCYSVIRGKRTPLSFKIVFQLSYNKMKAALDSTDVGIAAENITGLYLNLQYRNKTLLCTTGSSLKTFLPGKRLDQYWDGMILDFFRQNEILFEQV